ncbi:MAG: hypothetical protein H6753_02995 [Candidatus Omnitrophica bacterium]|nr:hypothetical protein [Candidatus Omnitrophota bacterium]
MKAGYQSPLLQALRQAKTWDTKVFFLIITLVFIFLSALLFSPYVQRLIMAKFHWRAKSFAAWGLLQFIPSMYSFSNEIVVTQTPVSQPLELAFFDQSQVQLYRRVNHFPLRMITFSPQVREFFVESRQNYYVYLRSHYRGVVLTTVYQMESNGSELRLKNGTP